MFETIDSTVRVNICVREYFFKNGKQLTFFLSFFTGKSPQQDRDVLRIGEYRRFDTLNPLWGISVWIKDRGGNIFG